MRTKANANRNPNPNANRQAKAPKLPQHVDDKWDLYWSHVTPDVSGDVGSG
jgi:hypothetical protein